MDSRVYGGVLVGARDELRFGTVAVESNQLKGRNHWVVVMAEGRIIAEGTPDQISANPAVIEAYLGGHQGKSLMEEA